MAAQLTNTLKCCCCDESTKFKGFYHSVIRPNRSIIESYLCSLFYQLCQYFGIIGQRIKIGCRGVKLATKHFYPNEDCQVSDDYVVFRRKFISIFVSGEVMELLLKRILSHYQYDVAKFDLIVGKYNNKKHAKLRAVYYFIDILFVSQFFPRSYNISFNTDLIYYGGWSCSHPNTIGYNLLMISWMLGVAELMDFVPEELSLCQTLRQPIFGSFLQDRHCLIDFTNSLSKKDVIEYLKTHQSMQETMQSLYFYCEENKIRTKEKKKMSKSAKKGHKIDTLKLINQLLSEALVLTSGAAIKAEADELKIRQTDLSKLDVSSNNNDNMVFLKSPSSSQSMFDLCFSYDYATFSIDKETYGALSNRKKRNVYTNFID